MSAGQSETRWRFPNAATPPGSAIYYSIRFAPTPLRDAFAALYAWRDEIQSILDQVSDPGVAAAKLDWWHTELARTFEGQGHHPLSLSLAPIIAHADLPPEPFGEVIESCAAVLALRYPPDHAAWIANAERDLGAIAELAARCAGLSDPSDLATARRAGAYCALVYRLRDSGWLLRKGHLGILPGDRLAAAGLSPHQLARPESREALHTLLAESAEYIARFGALSAGERDQLPSVLRIQCRLQSLLLAELTASDFAVLDQRISLTPIRKLWHAWLESRRS